MTKMKREMKNIKGNPLKEICRRHFRLIAMFSFLVSSFLFQVQAQDFSVRLTYGNTLYFTVTDAVRHEVKVVPPRNQGRDYYADQPMPAGALAIPSEVRHDGETYTVTAIGEWAFIGCTGLSMVVMPPTVERIEANAFYGCSGITERISIGKNVRFIGSSAFYGCVSLPEVHFEAADCETMGGTLSATAFGKCIALRRIIIGEGVTRIPDYAFCGIDGLVSLSRLPQSLQYIGSYAFAYCSRMTGEMAIPDQVQSIGECAFHQCHALNSLTLGNAVRHIGDRAFYHCIGLKKVTVKSFTPPAIEPLTFSNLSSSVVFSVPCVSKELYRRHGLWASAGLYSTFGNCSFDVNVSIDDTRAGIVLGSGNYAYGDSVKIMAVCAAGYSFDHWSDGNTDNPRVFLADNNFRCTAITRTAATLVKHDTVFRVDSVYVMGFKTVRDTVDIIGEALTINDIPELTFDKGKKLLKWCFPRNEEIISVSLYNQMGECVFVGDGRKGRVKLNRYPTGTYYVRVETLKRTLRCRLFHMSE